VWVLLQPRDFLTSSLLYTGVGAVLLGVIVGTFTGAGETFAIQMEAYKGFFGDPNFTSAPLFPILFVTIACGTISGFHSLVSSGTTAKQLDKETDARLIGYGGMLGEGLLATVALVTVSLAAQTPAGSGIGLALPNFAAGGGIVINTAFGIGETIAATFMGLVLVSFLLTSTDTAVRLGRYMMEEIVGTPETQVEEAAANRYVAAGIQILPAYLLVATGSWADLWPLFGGANQTLAALALLVATLWLANWDDSKQLLSTGVPMAIMFSMTTLALLYLAFWQNLNNKLLNSEWMAGAGTLDIVATVLQIAIALVLVYMAVSLVRMGYTNIKRARSGETVAADGGAVADDREVGDD
jgi:carbon starvation protein